MSDKPVAAGKSSIDLVDVEQTFAHIVSDSDGVYLDLACGVGRYTLEIAERMTAGSRVYAMDMWEEGVRALEASTARSGESRIKASVADITKPLPVESASVDVCLLATVLHDLPEQSQPGLLKEVHRVLKADGMLVLIEFMELDHGPGPGIAKRIGEAKAQSLAAPCGFVRDTSVILGEFTYLVRFVKV